MSPTLKVYWALPRHPSPDSAPVLSFLPPSVEDEFACRSPGPVIRARQAAGSQRRPARDLYLGLVARLGAIPCGRGRTFRQALSRPGEASSWWYHPVSNKDCEHDPALNWVIAVLTIRSAAAETGASRLELCGCPTQIARSLSGVYQVKEIEPPRPRSRFRTLLRGLCARARFALISLRALRALHRLKPPAGAFDVVLSGFWDWSFRWDAEAQALSDQYFKRVPEELRRFFSGTMGWLAWFEPDWKAGSEGRDPTSVLAPLAHAGNVAILQSFLTPWDVLTAVLDLSPLWTYFRVARSEGFRAALRECGIDFLPLFSEQLLLGFAGQSIPHCRCVALATERACARYRPEVALSFLEHFSYSRAHYEGVRRAKTGSRCLAVQHASYSHEKTMLFLDPTLEFHARADGCVVPHPDGVFAMGSLGRELLLECGYPEDRVWLTGSPRYDHVRDTFFASASSGPSRRGPRQPVRILLLPTLNLELELDMVDAACAAVQDLKGFQLLLRDHPLLPMGRHPRFRPFQGLLGPSSGDLAEDIEQADLVLFTYSTAAEEAYLRGRPAWQWLTPGFNASALAEAVPIKQFASVADLRRSLQEFQDTPTSFLPSSDDRAAALGRLFHTGEGAAARIASLIARPAAQSGPGAPSPRQRGTACGD